MGRGTETEETLKTRVGNANQELDVILEKTGIFQYRVTNDKREEASLILENIVKVLY